MHRKFPYITVGRIISELNTELKEHRKIESDAQALSRSTFYRLEARVPEFPKARRTISGKPWRAYTPEQSTLIKQIILTQIYGEPAP